MLLTIENFCEMNWLAEVNVTRPTWVWFSSILLSLESEHMRS
jgi:hypothetical protein